MFEYQNLKGYMYFYFLNTWIPSCEIYQSSQKKLKRFGEHLIRKKTFE
jgi:hypothetical protein